MSISKLSSLPQRSLVRPVHALATGALVLGLSATFAPALTSELAAPPARVSSWVYSDLAVYETGDAPRLFLRFENTSSSAVEGYLANAEQMDIFPCDLLWVSKNHERLAYVRGNEFHPRPRTKTVIPPGGTLTLIVPLEHVAVLPGDPTGHYAVQLIADYYPDHAAAGRVDLPGHPGGGTIEFDVRGPSRAAFDPAAPVTEHLRQAGWLARLAAEAPPEETAALAELARSPTADPGLRARAVRVLAQRKDAPLAPEAWSELFVAAEPIVALTALTECAGAPGAALVPALLHRDLGVRRAAAKKLAEAPLTEEPRARAAALLETEQDELVREFLARAIGR